MSREYAKKSDLADLVPETFRANGKTGFFFSLFITCLIFEAAKFNKHVILMYNFWCSSLDVSLNSLYWRLVQLFSRAIYVGENFGCAVV